MYKHNFNEKFEVRDQVALIALKVFISIKSFILINDFIFDQVISK